MECRVWCWPHLAPPPRYVSPVPAGRESLGEPFLHCLSQSEELDADGTQRQRALSKPQYPIFKHNKMILISALSAGADSQQGKTYQNIDILIPV